MTGVLLLALPVGALIGMVGIGGVLLPPALIWLAGLDPHAAAGTSSWCFLFTGLVGTVTYARKGVVPWGLGVRLTAGAAPAAAVGALVNELLPGVVLHLILAAVTGGSGLYNLRSRARTTAGRSELPTIAAVAVGAGVGFGSALTGTGGPVLLVPVLLTLGLSPLTTVAVSQVIQLPLVGFAVLGYAVHGSVRFTLGTLLGVLAGAGTLAGAALAHRLRQQHLHRVASITLVAAGAFLVALPFLPITGS